MFLSIFKSHNFVHRASLLSICLKTRSPQSISFNIFYIFKAAWWWWLKSLSPKNLRLRGGDGEGCPNVHLQISLNIFKAAWWSDRTLPSPARPEVQLRQDDLQVWKRDYGIGNSEHWSLYLHCLSAFKLDCCLPDDISYLVTLQFWQYWH